MDKCLILFVEGETEVEFYKRVIEEARIKMPEKRFETRIETKNVGGVGNFKNDVLRKFKKELKPKYGDETEYTVVLCSDTDVFEFSQNPPIKWKEVIKSLEDAGVKKVIHIQAKHSIEDWFLLDAEGIISFLKLPKKTKIPSGGTGYQKLKKLYSNANNMYYKGMKSNGMIAKLDLDKITKSIEKEIKPLYKVLGLKM